MKAQTGRTAKQPLPRHRGVLKKRRPISEASLKESGVILPFFVIPFRKTTGAPLRRYLKTVVKDFFFLQFSVSLSLRRIPVISVDHPLDELIPFCPDKVHIYLDFVHFWVRLFTFSLHYLPEERALIHAADYLTYIERAYAQAACVYRRYMSTTRRPKPPLFGKFRLIHLLDPHLACVPSLHVAIALLTSVFFSRVFREEATPEPELTKKKAELHSDAIAIIESVLFVKQHSVNCIPAAFCMCVRIFDGLITEETIHDLINDLFRDEAALPASSALLIRGHISSLFSRFLAESEKENWTDCICRWLTQYPQHEA